jgi:hypothetical protein
MKMKIKVLLSAGVLAAILALNLRAAADSDEVLFEGQTFCYGMDDCRNFAVWGPGTGARSIGYVVLYEADGRTISDYLWVDINGLMTFESDLPSGGFAELPPAYLRKLGGLIENGSPQQINQFFPGGVGKPLFIESKIDTTASTVVTTPEASTLLLFGPAALFLFGRAQRFWRT